MAELGPLQGCHESTHARVTQPGMSSSEHGAYNDGRYFGRYFELGSCEALGCAEGGEAHPTTSGLLVGEAGAAGGRQSALFPRLAGAER